MDNNDNSNNNLVQNLVDKFRDAGFFIDREWTDVIGYTMIGTNENENQHVYPFTTVLKEARLDVKSYRSKWITDEILSVDFKCESAGHRTQDMWLAQSYCKEGKRRWSTYKIENNYRA